MNNLQVTIKNNQTNNWESPIKKSLKQPDTLTSFDQILQMFQVNVNEDGQDSLLTVESSTEETGVIPSEEKEEEVAALLAGLLGLFKELQNVLTASASGENAQGDPSDSTNSGVMQLAGKIEAVKGQLDLSSIQEIYEIPGIRDLLQKAVSLLESGPAANTGVLTELAEAIEPLIAGLQARQDKLVKDAQDSRKPSISEPQSPEYKPTDAKLPLDLDKNQLFLSASSGATKPLQIKEEGIQGTANPSLFPSGAINVQSNGSWSEPTAPPKTVHVQSFVPEATRILGQITANVNGLPDKTVARFLLSPEHLGKVQIQVMLQDGQVTAEIITETLAARDVLEGQLSSLKQALQQQGIVVNKVDVVQQPVLASDSTAQGFSFTQGGFNSPQEQKAFQSQEHPSGKRTKSITLEEADIEKEITSYTYGSNSKRSVSSIDFTA
ncbi:flagellar hook-length control protein FliK [Bacillus sp. EB01]|uniref:flagellar hook-length control protein FliK n=1 Tax=Bacillus sp. EB01 TaxID=1347086 RepID=UPI0005C64B8B|nr:flagellar hook-length control protein FliK [Bacillus sp. EB01]